MKKSLLKKAIIIFFLAFSANCFAQQEATAVQFNSLGFSLLKQGVFSQAELAFKKAINLEPQVKYYHNNLAVVYIKEKNYHQAEKELKTALNIDSTYVKALANLAIVYFYLGEYRKAYSFYKKANKADQKYAAERFERQKVEKKLEMMQKENPENAHLDSILEKVKIEGY